MAAAVKWAYSRIPVIDGSVITDDVSGNLLQQVTRRINDGDVRYRFSYSTLVSITFTPVVSTVKQEGAYIDWDKLPESVLLVLKKPSIIKLPVALLTLTK